MLAFVLLPRLAVAGPPFSTDDPEPTPYRHWEIYLGSDYGHDAADVNAAAPLVELNYGLMPNVQFSLTQPMQLDERGSSRARYGFGDTELALKVRFVQESRTRPQVAFYPSLVLPGSVERGPVKTFLPLWLQKSWGHWTAYGGAGRWHNPGAGNRDWTFSGFALQKAVSPATSLGAEIFHSTPDRLGAQASTGFNVGALAGIDERHALVVSSGRGIAGSNMFSAYAAYELMLGPGH